MPSVKMSLSEQVFSDPPCTQESALDQPAVCFTRQLWQRTMPNDVEGASATGLYRRQRVSIGSSVASKATARPAHRQSLPIAGIRAYIPPLQAHLSDTPLTPEESPPLASTRKRSADQVEGEDENPSPTISGDGSDGSFQPCLCQPDPKVPRPRNGKSSILRKQAVVADLIPHTSFCSVLPQDFQDTCH